MAETIRAGGGPKTKAEAERPPAREQNIATEEDMQRAFSIFANAERTYEAFLATQREEKQTAKATRDKALSDAVVIVASRGVTKKVLRQVYDWSKLKADELVAEIKPLTWAIRAAGLPVGTQLAFFDNDDAFAGQDELLRRAYRAGRDAYVERKSDKDNPYHPSSQPGQQWLKGRSDAEADVIRGMDKKH